MEILKGKKAKVIILSVVAVLAVIYLGVAWFYSERFLMGTTINGSDYSEMTVEEVETHMQEALNEYALTIKAEKVNEEQLNSKDFDMEFTDMSAIQEAMDAQNAFTWPIALFQKRTVEATLLFDYDHSKLDKLISELACMKEESQVEAVSAIPVLKGNEFVIQEEVLGTQIDEEKLHASVTKAIQNMETEVVLRDSGCYLDPAYFAEDEAVKNAAALMNKALSTKITYQLDGETVSLDKSQIKQWLSVDEEMNVVLSEKDVREFARVLGKTYDTAPRTNQIITPTGKSAKVTGATKGREIGEAEECERLMGEILEGKVETREPIIVQHATPEGQYSWGKTYVEVDISAQHMWYIKNGSVIFESDVITGSPGRDTPAGIFEILTKKRDKVLRGNIDPVTGEREYETPVDYWARITWSGVGFHDATWQPSFGGQMYRQGYGSHGCINMPYNAVATFYGLISVGDPVVIHY